MNYQSEINSFYDWLETNPLATSGIVLWHALMHIANKAGWPDKFAVAVSVLELKTGLKKDAIFDARHKLQQVGRIKWETRKGNQSALYEIVPLVSDKQTQIPMQYPTQTPTQLPTQSPTINSLNNITTVSTANARVHKLFEQEFGYITGTVQTDLDYDIEQYGIDWVENAIKYSSKQGKRNYFYMSGVLKGWRSDGFTPGSCPWEKRGDEKHGKSISKTSAKARDPDPDYSEYNC
ncbi:DnaD domain-containing protein [Sporomusa paucivorans]|uniref:DnaD domain-containing protein n=1 Tax=Sporomusa paucivorans TaxID=2376 RepID=UPI0035711AC7